MQYASKLSKLLGASLAPLLGAALYASPLVADQKETLNRPVKLIGGFVDCSHTNPNVREYVIKRNAERIVKKMGTEIGFVQVGEDGIIMYYVFFDTPRTFNADLLEYKERIDKIIKKELCPKDSSA